jgi:periplasmic mercuric ion binding protein
MKKTIVIIMLMIGFTTLAQEVKNKNAKYDIEVKGNCDMCKKRIEKAAYSAKGVKSASWDSNTQILKLVLNEEKTSLANVQKAISLVGHDTKESKATNEAYENLHGCCKYLRE